MTEVELPGARAVFSTRKGGVSEGPNESLNLGILTEDDQDRVEENRRRLFQAADIDPGRVAMGWQVHGTDLREWDGPAGEERPRVDGHLTGEENLALLVLVADCLPVALADEGRVGMLHCGWRGLAGGIVDKAVERFEAPPAAAVGPGIGACCYEVGPEVLEHFEDLDGVADGRNLDLRGVAERRLRAAGVERIEHVDHCTSCRPDLYFSHRRDDGVTGRQAGLVVRT